MPIRVIGLYSLPAASMGFMGALISLYLLKFATDVLLIAPGVMGLLFGLSRLWDAVSDPLAGNLSDRTRSRIGRRRPWLLAAALPLGISFVWLWAPPSGLSGSSLVAWMGVGVLLFYTAQTAFNVPHASLGAELSLDHHDRTRVFAGRMLLDVLGILLAAGALFLLERSEDQRATATQVALLAAVVSAGLILITTAGIRERVEFQGRGGSSATAAFRDVLRNPHARLLFAVFLLETLGFTTMVTVMPFAAQYLLDLRGMTAPLIGCAVVMMLASVPLWPLLSRRFGKRNVWVGTLIMRSAAFAWLMVAPAGAWLPIVVGLVLIGAGFGGGNVLGPSVKSDVIDYDEMHTGQRKEGAYFASWNLAVKGGGGLAIALTGGVLQLAGFEANEAQAAPAQAAIRALFAVFPCLFYGLAAALLLRFRLDERAHAEIRSILSARAGRDVEDLP